MDIRLTYFISAIVLVAAVIFDLGLISKRNANITIKKALIQTLFWVSLSLAFFVFLWITQNGHTATKYITAYLMEWSLSIDNIFVFLLIFSFFKIEQNETGRILLIGILLAIIFRIAFIAL